MKKVFDEERKEKYYMMVSSYRNNNRLCINITDRSDNDIREEVDYIANVTINIPEISIDKINQVYLSNDISDGVKYKLLDNGIISKTIKTIEYNLDKYSLVEVDLEKLKEYDKEGVEEFLNLNQEKGLLNQYNKQEIKELLEKKEKLVYVDTGSEEIVVRYKDLPDVIVDLDNKLESSNLKVYDYDNPSFTPILTTVGYFLDKCDGNVRKDIIDRLMKLQLGELEVKDYKVIDEDMLDDVRNSIEDSSEMER